MQPQRNPNATLVDLLDRVLDKGLVVHADLIVSVAGIPLIGVNLRAALAGMETMLKYGIMQAWDEQGRAWERDSRSRKQQCVVQGEEVLLRMLGGYHSSEGIYTAWRYGYLYLTHERLLLHQQGLGEVLFEIRLDKIKALATEKGAYPNNTDRETLVILLQGDKTARLRAVDVALLKQTMEKTLEEQGHLLEKEWSFPLDEGTSGSFLDEGEKVLCSGKMWHILDRQGIMEPTWSSGHLYLTDQRLCWWHDFEKRMALEITLDQLAASTTETRDLRGMSKKKVLDVIYTTNGARRLASFSGSGLEEWHKILMRIAAGQGVSRAGDEIETCPNCGRSAYVEELLEEGCSECGWVSPKLVVSG